MPTTGITTSSTRLAVGPIFKGANNVCNDYVDGYLRLAAMAWARNNVQLSLELIGDALKVDEKIIQCFIYAWQHGSKSR